MLPYRTFTTIDLSVISIQVWGTLVAAGVLAAALLTAKRARRRFLNEEAVYDLIFYGMIAGLFGSRLMYVIEQWEYYATDIAGIFKFWQGGFSFTGGIILAFTVSYYYAKRHKLNFLEYADAFAPGIVLAQIFGRIGCYLIGDHLGTPTSLPWAIMQNGVLRHPVILYEIILLVIVFIALLKMHWSHHNYGRLFFMYLILFSTERFITDFFRADERLLGLTLAQYVTIGLFFYGMYWLRKRR